MSEAHASYSAANGAGPTREAGTAPSDTPGGAAEVEALLSLVRQLSDSEAGIAFIYQALQQLAIRYELEDAVVAVNEGSLNTQIFRLGRRPLDAPSAMRFHEAGAGVYSEPNVVPGAMKAGVEDLCRLALSMHIARYGSARDLLTGLPSRRVFNEALRSVAAQSARYGWHFTVLVLSFGTSRPSGASDLAPADFIVGQSGRALGRALRTGDLGTRVEGSTFAAILPNAGGDAVGALIERIHRELPSLSRSDVSFGSAGAPRESVDPVELLRLAGARLADHRAVSQ
jgi:GGDEF domain-containing protein